MKVLLIGYSSISKRRVIPALLSLGAESVDVASLSKSAWEWSSYLPLRMFRDYDQALDQTDAQAVYVSTVNSQHARWARKALQSGFHVIVDKPAFLSVAETQELIELAHRNQRCLAEATVYGCHPSISTARKAFEQAGTSPTHLIVVWNGLAGGRCGISDPMRLLRAVCSLELHRPTLLVGACRRTTRLRRAL